MPSFRTWYISNTVLCYLMMFRLEELGIGHFKRLVNSQHTGKMHKVCTHISTITNIHSVCVCVCVCVCVY